MLPDSATSRVKGSAQISRSASWCSREERVAARLAPAPLGDEIAAPRRKEEPVAVLDDVAQQLAAVVDREDLRPRLIGLDQRVVQLLERQRIVEQRRVDDAARDGDLPRRHHVTPPSPACRRRRRRAHAPQRDAAAGGQDDLGAERGPGRAVDRPGRNQPRVQRDVDRERERRRARRTRAGRPSRRADASARSSATAAETRAAACGTPAPRRVRRAVEQRDQPAGGDPEHGGRRDREAGDRNRDPRQRPQIAGAARATAARRRAPPPETAAAPRPGGTPRCRARPPRCRTRAARGRRRCGSRAPTARCPRRSARRRGGTQATSRSRSAAAVQLAVRRAPSRLGLPSPAAAMRRLIAERDDDRDQHRDREHGDVRLPRQRDQPAHQRPAALPQRERRLDVAARQAAIEVVQQLDEAAARVDEREDRDRRRRRRAPSGRPATERRRSPARRRPSTRARAASRAAAATRLPAGARPRAPDAAESRNRRRPPPSSRASSQARRRRTTPATAVAPRRS